MKLVTLDFHNTLVRCDEWFQLEISALPGAVLEAIACSGTSIPRGTGEHANSIYREIRQSAIDSGRERDAVSSMCAVADELGLQITHREIANYVDTIMLDALEGASPMPGAREFVEALKADRIPLAVVSSAAYHPFLEWSLTRFRVRSAFTHIVTSAACGIYKSDPAIYQYTLDLFGVPAEKAIHIGDSHRYDVVSASSIGMRTILVTDRQPEPLTPAPDAVVSTLGEARGELDKLLSSV